MNVLYEIRFTPTAEKTIKKWKKSSSILYKLNRILKLDRILQAVAEEPRSGIGHPEPLLGGDGITYSRRISASDRIVYDIYDDEILVLVIEVGGHYTDK